MKHKWISISLVGLVLAIGLLLGVLATSWQSSPEATAQLTTCNTAKVKEPVLKDLAFKGDGTQANPKVFELEVKEADWDVVVAGPGPKGAKIKQWTYNGQVPGPVIRVTQGDWVRIKVTNNLPEKVPAYAKDAKTTDTSVHFHGIHLPYAMDGVPPLTQDFIKPGKSFTHEFQVTQGPGTFMYHTHVDTEIQTDMGLYGVFVIEPKSADAKACDREYIMMISTGSGYFMLNGKAFPSSALGANPSNLMKVKKGERILIRMIDITATDTFHTMHPHGHDLKVIAKDGKPWDGPKMDSLLITSGERYDLLLEANADPADGKALWAFHCHILPHLANPDKATEYIGMGGLVTVIAYEK